MKSKRKLLISVLIALFVMIGVMSTIAIIFAATQQNIRTNLNVKYKAENIDATVSATMTIAGKPEENLTTATGATELVFEADNSGDTNGSLLPSSDITLTKAEKYVIFKYKFVNTGDNDFVAMFDYADTDTEDSNMKFGFKETATEYKETANSVLVRGNSTRYYYVKIEIENLAKNAHLSGAISWDMRSNIVVATPDNAQSVLDSNINGKTVVFSSAKENDGTAVAFSGELKLRTTKESSSVILQELDAVDNAEITYDDLEDGKSYAYKRSVNDVIFTATENATFEHKLSIVSRIFNPYPQELTSFDAIKGNDDQHYESFEINNITFQGLNFNGMYGRIYIELQKNDEILNLESRSTINNIKVNHCSFYTEETDSKVDNSRGAAVCLSIIRTGGQINNTLCTNNIIDGHKMGLYSCSNNNVTYRDNKISNTIHNGMAVQYSTGNYSTGNILIENNTVTNCLDAVDKNETDPTVWASEGQRAMRIGYCKDANIIIRNNNFNNCYYQVLCSGSAEGWFVDCTFEVYDNYYAGVKLPDQYGTNEMIMIKWCEI